MNTRFKTSTSSKIFDAANFIMLTLFAIACMYPFYYIFLYSISDSVAAARGDVILVPIQPDLSTYKQLLSRDEIMNAALVSATRTIIGTALMVLASSFFAYVLTRSDLPLKKTIYRYTIFTMYISAGLIPWYILMIRLGFKNNFMLYVIPGAIAPFNIILVKTYIEQIPDSLEEAARMDGAGLLLTFFRIIMPVSLPIIATIAIFGAIGQWNSWQDNFYLVNKRELMTLQMMLLNYLSTAMATGDKNKGIMDRIQQSRTISPMSLKMTMSVITVLPILCVYPILQKYFIHGIMIGSVKG